MAWTPALERMLDEGMDAIFERHARIAQRTRDGVKELGLSLFADESCASNTVTAVNVPEGVELSALMRQLQSDHDVVLAGGQGALDGKIMRVGHLATSRTTTSPRSWARCPRCFPRSDSSR